MRANIVLDDELVAETMKASGDGGKKQKCSQHRCGTGCEAGTPITPKGCRFMRHRFSPQTLFLVGIKSPVVSNVLNCIESATLGGDCQKVERCH